MSQYFEARATEEEKIEEFVWLVNNTPHIIPERMGEAEELCPAIVYAETNEETPRLYMGSPSDYLTSWPHEDIATKEASIGYRRISAVVILSESGVQLGVDNDRTNLAGGIEGVQAALGHEFDEIFVGGLAENPDANRGAQTLNTTGLIRHAAMYSRIARINSFSPEQAKLALGISISQLANGLPMADQAIIDMVRSTSI